MVDETVWSVYIVDDSQLVRDALRSLLRDLAGVSIVGEAGEATGAIEDIRRLRPKLVILDLSLPGGGLTVLQAIRDERIPTRVAVLTNYAERPYRRASFTLGADYFFDKSSEFDAIRRLCETGGASQPASDRKSPAEDAPKPK